MSSSAAFLSIVLPMFISFCIFAGLFWLWRRTKFIRMRRKFQSGAVFELKDWLKNTKARKQVFNKPGVYCMFNDVTKEAYVGQSINVGDRVRQHCYGDAFTNFDATNWKVQCVIFQYYDKPSLDKTERELIKAFSTKYRMKNRTKGNK